VWAEGAVGVRARHGLQTSAGHSARRSVKASPVFAGEVRGHLPVWEAVDGALLS